MEVVAVNGLVEVVAVNGLVSGETKAGRDVTKEETGRDETGMVEVTMEVVADVDAAASLLDFIFFKVSTLEEETVLGTEELTDFPREVFGAAFLLSFLSSQALTRFDI